ncbi:MAG: flagellar hook protein FlgE [Azonexus sp.]
MSFDTAISGLQAATTDLSVIGNNVANASSIGFKSSRAQFADVYAANSAASNAVGMGTRVAGIDQLFTQGSLSLTNNTLDLAIDDQGFFGLSDRGAMVYTRAGAFNTDNNGYIVNANGQRLTGYQPDGLGGVSGQRGDLRIDTSIAAPMATTQVGTSVNLNSASVRPGTAWPASPFIGDTPPATGTYNSSTSVSIYDNLGNSHELALYFVVSDTPNTWDVHTLIDGITVGATPATQLPFDANGFLPDANALIQIDAWQPQSPGGGNNGAATQDFTISLAGSTQFGRAFSVESLTQDGATAGQLSRIGIDDSGIITGYYSNNQSKALGQVALYNFSNPQGLTQLGDTAWGESPDSGLAQVGAPGTGSLGSIKSGALEQSNVDVTGELVRLILAQRNYQASAQVIEADNKVTQTILNIQ